jgi:hypothetical protein
MGTAMGTAMDTAMDTAEPDAVETTSQFSAKGYGNATFDR